MNLSLASYPESGRNFQPRLVLPEVGPDERLGQLATESGGRFDLHSRLQHVLPILPSWAFARIPNQEGCFSFHPDGAGQLDGAIRGFFDVPLGEKRSILADLRGLGVTWTRVMPGLDGTARALRDEHLRP